MLSSSTPEASPPSLGPYIDELHEFLTARHLSCGQPEDLRPFTDRLGADPSFRDEVASLMRSVLYREDAQLSTASLTRLLTLTVAGASVDGAAEGLQVPLRELQAFVTSAVRAVHAPLASEPETVPSETTAGGEAGSSAQIEGPPAWADVATSAAYPEEHEPAAPSVQSQAHPNDNLSRALTQTSSDFDGYEQADPSSRSEHAEVPETDAVSSPRPNLTRERVQLTERRSPNLGTLLQRWYWLPGVCLLVLAMGISWKLTHHRRAALPGPEAPASHAATPPPSSTAVSNAPEIESSPRPTTQPTRSPSRPKVDHTSVYGSGAKTNLSQSQPALDAKPTRSSTPSRASRRDASPGNRSYAPEIGTRVDGGSPREGVFLASSGSMAAHLTYAPAPGYPKLASLTRVEGEVILQVVVSRSGTVAATRVLQGPYLLRSAAEHAVRRWRYRPYLVSGKATDVATIVTVTFRLHH